MGIAVLVAVLSPAPMDVRAGQDHQLRRVEAVLFQIVVVLAAVPVNTAEERQRRVSWPSS